MTTAEFAEIKARHAAAIPGPWEWYGNTYGHNKPFYLATVHGGRKYVMDFARLGMDGGQPRFAGVQGGFRVMQPGTDFVRYDVAPIVGLVRPKPPELYREDWSGLDNPDATFLAESWADMDALIKHVDGTTKTREDGG